MLIHKIPYFRELIIASFSCEWSPDDKDDEEAEDEERVGDGEDKDVEEIEVEAKGCGYTNNEGGCFCSIKSMLPYPMHVF